MSSSLIAWSRTQKYTVKLRFGVSKMSRQVIMYMININSRMNVCNVFCKLHNKLWQVCSILIYFNQYMGFIYKLNLSQLESSDHVTLVHLYIFRIKWERLRFCLFKWETKTQLIHFHYLYPAVTQAEFNFHVWSSSWHFLAVEDVPSRAIVCWIYGFFVFQKTQIPVRVNRYKTFEKGTFTQPSKYKKILP